MSNLKKYFTDVQIIGKIDINSLMKDEKRNNYRFNIIIHYEGEDYIQLAIIKIDAFELYSNIIKSNVNNNLIFKGQLRSRFTYNESCKYILVESVRLYDNELSSNLITMCGIVGRDAKYLSNKDRLISLIEIPRKISLPEKVVSNADIIPIQSNTIFRDSLVKGKVVKCNGRLIYKYVKNKQVSEVVVDVISEVKED